MIRVLSLLAVILRECSKQRGSNQYGWSRRVFDNIFTERLWRSVKYEEVYIKDYQVCRDAREGLEAYFHFITIGGIIKHWNIKNRMRFIMEFLVGISKERIAMGKGGIVVFRRVTPVALRASFRYPSEHCCS